MTQHNQTHQTLIHSTYRDSTWGTSDVQDTCTKCHHPQREHANQTCPACRQQSVHKCPPGYIDESDTRARYHSYYCEKCIQPQKHTSPDVNLTPCPKCPHAWNNHAYFVCSICRMLIQACPHYQTFVDHTAWETAKATPMLTCYTCTDCAIIEENQTNHLLPKTKELAQLEQHQMLFQWTANQQGIVNYQQHGEDHLWEPIPCEPTLVGSSVDSLGNLIVKGTPGYVITDTNRRQAIVLCCYQFNDQNG